MLGLGLTALLASFMSGMAGNVTAFNTVWTYDIYQSHIRPGASRRALPLDGPRGDGGRHRCSSIAAAYVAGAFNNIMDLLQLVFAFVNAPLFATFVLGMFWKRTTGHGAFVGLLAGTLAAAIHHGLTLPAGAVAGVKGGYLGDAAHLPERAGADLLDRDRRVDHVLRRHDRREPRHARRGRRTSSRASSTRSRPGRATAPLPLVKRPASLGRDRARR